MPRRYYSSTAVETTLTAQVSNSTTTFPVASTSGFPAQTPYTLIVDEGTVNEEVVTVTGVSTLNLTVTRGVDGTSAVSHANGATVKHGVSARDFDEANSHVNDTSTDVHTQYVLKSLVDAKGDLLTATADNTPARLAVGTTNGHVLKVNSATATGLEWGAASGGIAETLIDAKGDLIVGSAADTAARLAVGTNGHALLADSGATNGVKWGAVGKVLQVVTASKTDTFTTSTSGSWVDITGLSASITPTATTSTILVVANLFCGLSTTNSAFIQLLRGSTAVGIGDASGNKQRATTAGFTANDNRPFSLALSFVDSPATTSSTTYKLQFRQNAIGGAYPAAGNFYVNRHATENDDNAWFVRAISTITIFEIGA